MKCTSLTECKFNSANDLSSRSWNEKEYKSKVEDSPQSVGEVNELDQYVFVVHVQISEY